MSATKTPAVKLLHKGAAYHKYLEDRNKAILKVMNLYTDEGFTVPIIWVEEYRDNLIELQKPLSQEEEKAYGNT